MNYRAIIKCRACSAKNTTDFHVESDYSISIKNAQDTIDSMVEITCDQCSENDWRVLEVTQLTGASRV